MNNRRYALELTDNVIFKAVFKKYLQNKFIQSNILHMSDIKLEKLAKILLSLYHYHIMRLTRESMSEFAEMLAKIIHFAAIKNRIASLDGFCNPALLHHIVLSFCDHIANHSADLFPKKVEKHSHRGYLKKSAIFCIENQNVYISEDAQLEKYGLVTFKDKESWRAFKHLQHHKLFTKKSIITIASLQQHSFFNQEEQDTDFSRAEYDNDAYFNSSY